MQKTTLSNFLNNTEAIINNTLYNKEFTKITTEDGNVVLITEEQFVDFLEFMCQVKQK